MRQMFFIIGILLVLIPQISVGCAVCYGDPQSPMTAGLNQAIFLLLGVIGVILSLVFTAGVFFTKRNKMLTNSETDS
jgi:heme/copper-type cytochrome/quinol oxidase subunit 2|tara:strand:+ start:132 stop:362 length:231 start_codon:yes stop_codon:yes gene_type:complete